VNVENTAISKIKPYENNPRINEKAVEKVANSLREFGFQQPIVVDKDGVIIVGHTRLKAAEMLGLKEVPVLVAKDLTEAQVKAYRLADNKTAEFSEWDMDLLAFELEGLEAFDFDMLPFGFEIAGEVTEDDFDADEAISEIEEEGYEPFTKLGQIWKLGNHRLLCGDSTKQEDVDRLMDGKLAAMVFTDPPWNVNYGAVDEKNAQGYKPRTILNDSMGTEDFKEFMQQAFSCMSKASEPGAMTYVVMSAQEWGNVMLALSENDYHWSSTIIWNKDRLVLSRKDYHTKYEPIWYGWKSDGPRNYPLADRKQSDVWDIDRPSKSDEHPTMKPIELVARAIKNSSGIGSNVLDLFGGSGTTLIAAEKTGRKCFMMELDPKYCDVIIRRWEELTGEKAELLD
jgi:DNA modification methylase